jgi:hypothetical protein
LLAVVANQKVKVLLLAMQAPEADWLKNIGQLLLVQQCA